jgi:uncharacterized integral membrane protein
MAQSTIERTGRTFRAAVSVVLLILLGIFAMLNLGPVEI